MKCLRCKNIAIPNKTKCDECSQHCVKQGKQRRKKLKIAGLCTQCGKNKDGNSIAYCLKCSRRKISSARCRRNKLIKLGLCACSKKLYAGKQCFECYFKRCCCRATGNIQLWRQLYNKLVKQKFCCIYTNRKLIPTENMSIDHIIPTTKGGSSNIDNLQWIDEQINRMKNDFTHDEFIETMKFIIGRLV